MKKMIATLALSLGAAAFAGTTTDAAPRDSLVAKYAEFQHKDSVATATLASEVAAWKAKVSEDSAKIAALKAALPAKPDTNWSAQIPDSVKAAFDSNGVKIAKLRDSLKTSMKLQGDSLKAKFDSLKADTKAKRDAFIAQLSAADKAKVQAKVEALDKKNDARRAAIEKGIAEAKARLEAQKSSK